VVVGFFLVDINGEHFLVCLGAFASLTLLRDIMENSKSTRDHALVLAIDALVLAIALRELVSKRLESAQKTWSSIVC
jgi:hypothetical protein